MGAVCRGVRLCAGIAGLAACILGRPVAGFSGGGVHIGRDHRDRS